MITNINSYVGTAQHYVPQFYLRNFASKRKKGYLICCFDKATKKTFKPNIRNVAQQTGFYDFDLLQGDKSSVEFLFSDIESKTNIAIQELLNSPTLTTLEGKKLILARFIIIQELRTLVFRDNHDYLVSELNRFIGKFGASTFETTENDTRVFQAQFIIKETSKLSEILLQMKWILLKNETQYPFWTSDNPVCRYNPLKTKFFGNAGLQNEGIQMLVPISPWLAIIVCDPFGYAKSQSEYETNPSTVEFMNSNQVVNSRQYIFSISDNFELAKQVITEHKSYSEPSRQRIVMS